MSVLAVAPDVVAPGYEQLLVELAEPAVLFERGWDEGRAWFVPAPSDPVFGYARCPVKGCENVTEHTATSLCTRCQHRFGRWRRQAKDGELAVFLAEVVQTRSEDPERLCVVCRTPGHERPSAARGLCFSCLRVADHRGQSPGAYVAGDEQWPAGAPRVTFGPCRMSCDALAVGGDGLCGEHLRRWGHAGRPAGAAFGAWRAERDGRLPAARFVDLGCLSARLRAEVLVGLTASIARHRRTRITDLRRVVNLLAATRTESVLDLDAAAIDSTSTRLFIAFCQDRIRLALSDPDSEFPKDLWDTRVFGKPQRYRLDFATIEQPWLRELAKQWAREKLALVHAMSVKSMLYALGELSRALGRRPDGGADPTALGRADITALLIRLGRLRASTRLTAWQQQTFTAAIAQFLREARDFGLGAPGRPLFGLPSGFALTRADVRAIDRPRGREPGRALPDIVLAQLLDEPALALLESRHGATGRAALEVLADTGRRPSEICELAWDCLDYDTHTDESGTERKLAVLIHDMPKVARHGCRLPIDEHTAQIITAQKQRIRERYPDTPAAELRLLPRLSRNPDGRRPMVCTELSRMLRNWMSVLPAPLNTDNTAFARERVIPYAFRHSYAQRHADAGTPVEVLRELMGHESMVTTQGYFRVRQERTRKAVQALAPLQIDRDGKRTMPIVEQLLQSERLRAQVGQTAVPLGVCTEPSNVKARGTACPYRFQCLGCEHFRTDPASQPELRDYLHQLLSDRERLATAVPQLAEWARREAAPSQDEIAAVRGLIRRNDELIEQLDPGERAAVLEAIAIARRMRAQLRTTIPDRFRAITRAPRPTLTPLPIISSGPQP